MGKDGETDKMEASIGRIKERRSEGDWRKSESGRGNDGLK
jgi:hypothetical protein